MASTFGSSITGSNRHRSGGATPAECALCITDDVSWISAFENGPSTQPVFVWIPNRLLELQCARRVPAVSDRIAQTAVKMWLEPRLDPLFHDNSYGYRPGKSALEAIAVTRRRCWDQDWVVELDIEGCSKISIMAC